MTITSRARSSTAASMRAPSAALLQRKAADHRCQESCSGNKRIEQNGFIIGMRTFADGTHSIQRRNTQGCGKGPVRTSTRCCFLQFKTQSIGDSCCVTKKSNRPGGTLHGRPVDSSGHFQAALSVKGTQGAKLAVDARSIYGSANADVELSPARGWHHVGSRAAADHAGIDCDSAPGIGEGAGALDLPPKFQHRAVPAGKIHATMSSHSVYVQTVTRDSFAGGFIGSWNTLGWFQYKDGIAFPGQGLSQSPRIFAACLLIAVEQKEDGTV